MFMKRSKTDPGRPNAAAVYQNGLKAFETGRFKEAIALLGSIAEGRNLPGTLARFYLGQSHIQQGILELNAKNHQVAANHFAEARRINPDSTGLSRYLAACHLGQERFDLAAAELQRDERRATNDETIAIRLAHALVRDGQPQRAIQTLVDAIDASPRRADVRFQLGLMHASMEQYDAAIEQLAKAADLTPLNASIQQHLGLAYAAQQRHAEAAACLTAAQRLRPGDAYIGLLLSMARAAAQATAVEPCVAPTIREEDCDDPALTALGEVIVSDPDFVEAFLSLPESQLDGDIFAMLAATLERALGRHPEYADLHYHCSRVYQRLGRTNAAIDRANHAIALNPRYTQALIQLGRLYALTDRGAEALERLGAAIAAGADYPDVHFLVGELHRKRGDQREARNAYRRALALNSNYRRAQEALELVTA